MTGLHTSTPPFRINLNGFEDIQQRFAGQQPYKRRFGAFIHFSSFRNFRCIVNLAFLFNIHNFNIIVCHY